MTERSLKIAVDFGGVCSVHSDRYELKDSSDLEIINIPKCVESLQAMRKAGHKLILLSFCGSKRAAATHAYLVDKNLFDELIFVKKRQFKAAVCARYGIDVLIDDRYDILCGIKPTQSILFTYESKLLNRPIKAAEYMHVAGDWDDVLKILPNIKNLDLPERKDVDTSGLVHPWKNK